MKVLKHILRFIIEPFRYLNSRAFTEKAVAYFQKHRFWVYIIATLITLVIVFFVFVYGQLV